MSMERRKIGEIEFSFDGLSGKNTKIIWSNVWNYNNKIWFSMFFTLDSVSDKEKQMFESNGFKVKHNISKYGSYFKIYIIRPHDKIQEWFDTLDGLELSVDNLRMSGVETVTYKINLTKDAQYVFNEKIVDSL